MNKITNFFEEHQKERLARHCSIDEKTGCWLWKKAKTNAGYGLIFIGKKGFTTHRYSYRLYRGEFDLKLCVLHKCDVRVCINPDHLFLGTRKDNMKDASEKKRCFHQTLTNCPRGHKYAGKNLRITKEGHRKCKSCEKINSRNSYLRKKSR